MLFEELISSNKQTPATAKTDLEKMKLSHN